MLIPLIQPRKLVLVGGSEEETLSLAEDCKKLITAQLGASVEHALDVFTPPVGRSVDASVDTNAWVVKLADPLVKRLKWQNVRGLGIVTITGILLRSDPDETSGAKTEPGHGDEDASNKRQKIEGGDGEGEGDGDETLPAASSALIPAGPGAGGPAPLPTLDVLPTNLVSATRSGVQPLHVGDLRLADLRRAMQSSGHTAEFRGEGTLLIDGSVVVRKTVTGRIELESVGLPADSGPTNPMGNTFYAVKRKIYEGLAVVAGA